MAGKLITLFDSKLRDPANLVSGPVQTIESLGGTQDSEALLRKIRTFEDVKLKVDYSDFSNFVFFNSALDYFNITGEKILNHYPYDGTAEELQLYLDDLDDYQKYVVSVWPSTTGYLNFVPTSGWAYAVVNDMGNSEGVTQTGILSPSTGSFAVEFWLSALTGSPGPICMIAQRADNSSGYMIYQDVEAQGPNLGAVVFSGSTSLTVNVPVTFGTPTYYCVSYDRDAGVLSVLSGSQTKFPVLAGYASGTFGPLGTGSIPLYIGSGSIPTPFAPQLLGALSGAVDDLRIWNTTRTVADVSSSFNCRISAQPNLVALYHFNESGSLPQGEREIILDSSGHKLHARITNYYSGLRNSGSLLPFDEQDLILNFDAPEVQAYIAQQQASGSDYDLDSDNIITQLFPEQFFVLEEMTAPQAAVLKNFLYVIARHYDRIKVSTDQFVNVLRSNYGQFDQTPDALLQDAARFFGWEFNGNFLSSDAVQYILGKNVLPNMDANQAVEKKLFEIKNEFWRRTLLNLMHIYKTKGSRESVESLLRVYGVNGGFIRLKEHGAKREAGIGTFRVAAEKSLPTLAFGSGTVRSYVSSPQFATSGQTVEMRVSFPTQTSSGLTASFKTGSLWTLSNDVLGTWQQLEYRKSDPTNKTGSLAYTLNSFDQNFNLVSYTFTADNLPIFDERWFNVAVYRHPTSGSIVIDVRHLDDEGTVDYHATGSYAFGPVFISTASYNAWAQVGTTGSKGSQYWAQEFKVWDQVLTDRELDDHTLNFQSYGTDRLNQDSNLRLRWRMSENVAADSTGHLTNAVYDYSGLGNTGTGFSFAASVNPYKKFLLDYNYIASPEYGWNEEKIRSFDTSRVPVGEAFQDDALVSLEFNLVDALNEDISQIVSSLEDFNRLVGAPANRYRDSYPNLDALRRNYFKRLAGSLNFTKFADFLEFFDRTFIDMVRKLIPARATFLGDEFVVESHMLERPKHQWPYRRRDQELVLEGVIQVYIRT